MKKYIAFILAVIMVFTTFLPVSAAQKNPVTPLYLNTSQASVTINIDDDGNTTIGVICIGGSTATAIKTVTYLERKIYSRWVRVETGTTDKEWIYNTTSTRIALTYRIPLTFSGEYRAVTEFTVYGTTETETFTLYNTDTY